MNPLAEQVIVDIIKTKMALPDDQVFIRDQNKLIFPKNSLYIVVGMIDSQVLSVVNTTSPTYDGMEEVIQVVMRENIQIDILSRSTEALYRRAEVLLALRSEYSEQQQEEYQFSIFANPSSFVNTSSAEGGSYINRFTITIACHTMTRSDNALVAPYDYYNDFRTRADDERTIGTENGLFEFEIKEE